MDNGLLLTPLLIVGAYVPLLGIGAYVAHRVIRSAISEGMKDYTLWKIQLDAELNEEDSASGQG